MAPDNKVPYQDPVLLLFVVSDTPHDGSVICKLLDVTRSRVVAEVCGVKSEEDGGQHSPLWSSSAADHSSEVMSFSQTYCGLS